MAGYGIKSYNLICTGLMESNSNTFLFLVSTLLLCIVSTGVVEAGDGEYDLKISGFGTLGYTQADKYDDRFFRRNINQDPEDVADNGFLADSRFGLQLNKRFNDDLEVVFQGVIRHQYSDKLEDFIDSAFLRYTYNENVQLRLGRMHIDSFFLSDHRHVGYSYDWVRPPSDTYSIIVYNAFNGAKAVFDWGEFDSAWQWSVAVGKTNAQFGNDAISAFLDETRGDDMLSTSLIWQNFDWNVKFSYAKLNMNATQNFLGEQLAAADQIRPIWSLPAELFDNMYASGDFSYGSVGISRQLGSWYFLAEATTLKNDLQFVQGQQYYIHVAKSFGNIKPYVTFRFARDGRKFDLTPPPNGFGLEGFYAQYVAITEQTQRNQDSIALGVRYDFAPQKALKFQCDTFFYSAGAGTTNARIDGSTANDETRSWCSLNFDWVF